MQPLSLPPNLSTYGNKKLRSEFTKRLSSKLKGLRKSKNITQQQLAEKSGLHLTYVGHLELGKYHPTVYVLWKISKALDMSLDKFIEF